MNPSHQNLALTLSFSDRMAESTTDLKIGCYGEQPRSSSSVEGADLRINLKLTERPTSTVQVHIFKFSCSSSVTSQGCDCPKAFHLKKKDEY